MSKQEFLDGLRSGLSGLPQDDIEERLAFYGEMLDDMIEEGISEEEAVLKIGDVDEIVRQTVDDIPLARIAKERIKPKRRLKVWEKVFLALGSPIWLSLGIAAVCVILALYVSLWSIVAALWAVFGSLAVCVIAGVFACVFFAAGGNIAPGLAVLSAAIVCAGGSIFLFFGCKETTKGILLLTKKFTIWLKNRFIRKEQAQ